MAAQYRAVAGRSVAVAARLLRHLSALTRYAVAAHGVGDATLVQRVKALIGGVGAVAPRDVVIPDDRQGAWRVAIDGEPARVGRYLRALTLTGCRANELRRLPLAGWDSAAAVLRIATTKNGKAHTLPAGALLRSLLDEEAASARVDAEARAGAGKPAEAVLFDIPEQRYQDACERVGAAIGVDFHAHDLRRTFATTATRAGIEAGTLKRLMNHSASGVTEVHYVRRTVEDLRPAMETIEARFAALWEAHA